MTFPSHAAAVMPLKLACPAWFDGVALVVGSTVPDLPFAVGAPLPTYGHTWAGLVLWGVPLTVAGAVIIRRSAPVVAAHLPGWWRHYGVLGFVRHRWYVTVISGFIGALTHRLWDEFTHDRLGGTSLGFAALAHPVVGGVPWWLALHAASSMVGVIGSVWATVHIGRSGLLVKWHGPPPHVAPKPWLYWSTTVCAMAAGASIAALAPDGNIPIVLAVRLLVVLGCAFAVAAIVASPKHRISCRARSSIAQ